MDKFFGIVKSKTTKLKSYVDKVMASGKEDGGNESSQMRSLVGNEPPSTSRKTRMSSPKKALIGYSKYMIKNSVVFWLICGCRKSGRGGRS